MISLVARRAVAQSARSDQRLTTLSSGIQLNYAPEQSVGIFSGVLDDSGQLQVAALGTRTLLRVCSCEAASYREPLALYTPWRTHWTLYQ